jgi:flagellar basal-body rod protein FlgF
MKDIYVALSGATAAWDQLSGIANNLANGRTQGFREARTSFELVGDGPVGGMYAATGKTSYSTADGALQIDDVATHVALRGDGFFALGDGTFTRDGTFHLDAEGTLVTRDGVPVLADGGELQVPPGAEVNIGPDGTVRAGKDELGKLTVVTLGNPSPLGGKRWAGEAGDTPEGTRVVQGAVEGSNADTMRGMIEMIEASRFFEAQQKVIQTSDDTRARLNRIGGS